MCHPVIDSLIKTCTFFDKSTHDICNAIFRYAILLFNKNIFDFHSNLAENFATIMDPNTLYFRENNQDDY